MRKCPKCGSRKAQPSHRKKVEAWLGVLAIRPFRCCRCLRRFWWFERPSLAGAASQTLTLSFVVLATAVITTFYMSRLPYAREAALPERSGRDIPAPPAGRPLAIEPPPLKLGPPQRENGGAPCGFSKASKPWSSLKNGRNC